MKKTNQLSLFEETKPAAGKNPKPVVGKKCPSHKNHQLSKIAAYLLNSVDKQDEIDGIKVRSVYLTESKAPRKMADWVGIFTQMKNKHYLVPTGEENRYYVFTNKREGTAFTQRLRHPAKSAAA